jgi:hypothetical protein
MRTIRTNFLFLIPLMLTSFLVPGQTQATFPKITDLFSASEVKKAGLSKLNADEIAALNAALFRVFLQLNSKSSTLKPMQTHAHSEGRHNIEAETNCPMASRCDQS